MKKVVSLMIVFALVAIILPIALSTNVLAQEITLSSGGSLSDAIEQVADGGTIVVDGTVAVTSALGTHGKNITITGSGRYGIKVKGTLNISNTVHNDHALSISGCVDHAIDVENGGKVICNFNNVPADTDLIQLFENEAKGLNVRKGGDATLIYVSEEA